MGHRPPGLLWSLEGGNSITKARAPAAGSEHPVWICALFGQNLKDIPVLDDLSLVVEPENIDPGIL